MNRREFITLLGGVSPIRNSRLAVILFAASLIILWGNAAMFGVLVDPAFPPTPSMITDLQAAARTLGLQLFIVNAGNDSDLETALWTFNPVVGGYFRYRGTHQLKNPVNTRNACSLV